MRVYTLPFDTAPLVPSFSNIEVPSTLENPCKLQVQTNNYYFGALRQAII